MNTSRTAVPPSPADALAKVAHTTRSAFARDVDSPLEEFEGDNHAETDISIDPAWVVVPLSYLYRSAAQVHLTGADLTFSDRRHDEFSSTARTACTCYSYATTFQTASGISPVPASAIASFSWAA